MKTSFVNERELARQFEEGDSVLLPIFTRGNRYAPHYGKIVTILDGIGQLDVATPMGTIRVSPTEVVKDDVPTDHLEDMEPDTWDKRKNRGEDYQTGEKVSSRVAQKYHNAQLRPLVKEACALAQRGLSGMGVYNSLFEKYSSQVSHHTVKDAVDMAKEALYWKEKGRQYIPSKQEWAAGDFTCPKCKCSLSRGNYKKHTKLYVCEECLWMIRPDDLLDKSDPEVEVQEETPLEEGGGVDWFTKKDPVLKGLYE